MSAVACFYYKLTTDRWLDLQDECQLLEFVMVGGASNLVSVVLVMYGCHLVLYVVPQSVLLQLQNFQSSTSAVFSSLKMG
jgi:hypothetical protein